MIGPRNQFSASKNFDNFNIAYQNEFSNNFNSRQISSENINGKKSKYSIDNIA
jgi:hypothetical protein